MSGVLDDLEGKVVVVTGASRGVGRGIVRFLAGHGARLAISARGAEGLADVSAELDRSGAAHVARAPISSIEIVVTGASAVAAARKE